MERGEQLITPEEIQLVTGLDYEGAKRDHAHVRKTIGSNSPDLLLSQYCKYYDLDVEEIQSTLYPERWQAEAGEGTDEFPEEFEAPLSLNLSPEKQ